ncbi:MAG: aspartate aminotransferase family protein [Rikenellaceae bacterium]
MNEQALRIEGDTNTTKERQEWNSLLCDSTLDILNEDAKYFLKQSLSTPCMNSIAECDGVFIVDDAGKRYFDFHGNSVHQLGYNNRYIIDRVQRQMNTLSFSPRRYANKIAAECAKRLTDLSPIKNSRVLFTTGGASSISVALKIARVYTSRYKTISMYDSFHGANIDSISIGGEQLFRNGIGPLVPGAIHVPALDTYRGFMGIGKYPNCEEILLDTIRYKIEKEGDIAALIAEPIRSTSVHVPSKGFWSEVKRVCSANGVLLIFDEVPTSMGRTGKLFATENFDVEPDMIVLGKGLAAGVVPFSAVIADARLDVAEDVALGHYTFEKNPVAAQATLASLDYIEEFDILNICSKKSSYMKSRLEAMKDKFDSIGDVRGIGMHWGVEIVKDRVSREGDNDKASRIFYSCLKDGLSFKLSSGSVITLAPPLIITQEQLDESLTILERAINRENIN